MTHANPYSKHTVGHFTKPRDIIFAFFCYYKLRLHSVSVLRMNQHDFCCLQNTDLDSKSILLAVLKAL